MFVVVVTVVVVSVIVVSVVVNLLPSLLLSLNCCYCCLMLVFPL